MVHLKKINHDNWMECIELDVHDWQKQFVNPNILSLAEAYAHSDANKEDAEQYYRCIPFGIYCNDQMIGFRNCRKISDTDCAGYFFESAVQKT